MFQSSPIYEGQVFLSLLPPTYIALPLPRVEENHIGEADQIFANLVQLFPPALQLTLDGFVLLYVLVQQDRFSLPPDQRTRVIKRQPVSNQKSVISQ